MTRSLLSPPDTDPTPAFDAFNQQYGSYVLAAAIGHFGLFDELAKGAMSGEALRAALGLSPRAAAVMFTALRAMGFVTANEDGLLELSRLSVEHLRDGGEFETARYFRMRAQAPEVMSFAARLRSNAPGNYFIFRQGRACLMDDPSLCRELTLAMVGRAKPAAPHFVRRVSLADARVLLDVGCGSGIYGIACLQAFPRLKVIAMDHRNVLEVTRELAAEYGVAGRLECVPADMFADELPGGCDAVLLSNVLHDWDVPECGQLMSRCAGALERGGQLIVHDCFLRDAMDGPLPVALHSAGLFCATRGRAYSGAECAAWLAAARLAPTGPIRPTLMHHEVLAARKPA